jgi:hypothetical protein
VEAQRITHPHSLYGFRNRCPGGTSGTDRRRALKLLVKCCPTWKNTVGQGRTGGTRRPKSPGLLEIVSNCVTLQLEQPTELADTLNGTTSRPWSQVMIGGDRSLPSATAPTAWMETSAEAGQPRTWAVSDRRLASHSQFVVIRDRYTCQLRLPRSQCWQTQPTTSSRSWSEDRIVPRTFALFAQPATTAGMRKRDGGIGGDTGRGVKKSSAWRPKPDRGQYFAGAN